MDICPMIKEHLEKYESVMKEYSPKLARLYRNCYLHTFDAFSRREDGTLSDYLVSGDIPAMWLRDSSAQLWNYVCFANDPEIGGLIRSVIKKQFSYIAVDPYANAFNEQPSDRGHTEDIPRKSPWVWERKYELDSLSYPLRLIYKYYKVTGDGAFIEEVLPGTVKTILDVLETEQHHFEKSEYRFSRETDRYNDTLHNDGMGEPVGYTGMTWQGFRPSDDAVSYGYNIPGNIFAYVVLGYASELLKNCAPEIAERAERLRQEMLDGVKKYGITEHYMAGAYQKNVGICGYNAGTRSFEMTGSLAKAWTLFRKLRQTPNVEGYSLRLANKYVSRFGSDDEWAATKLGRTVMMDFEKGTYSKEYYETLLKNCKWTFHPYPQAIKGRMPIHIDHAFMLADTKVPDEAFKVLSFMTYSSEGNKARLNAYTDKAKGKSSYKLNLDYYTPVTTHPDVVSAAKKLFADDEVQLYMYNNISNCFRGDPDKIYPSFGQMWADVINVVSMKVQDGTKDPDSSAKDLEAKATKALKVYWDDFDKKLANVQKEWKAKHK